MAGIGWLTCSLSCSFKIRLPKKGPLRSEEGPNWHSGGVGGSGGWWRAKQAIFFNSLVKCSIGTMLKNDLVWKTPFDLEIIHIQHMGSFSM